MKPTIHRLYNLYFYSFHLCPFDESFECLIGLTYYYYGPGSFHRHPYLYEKHYCDCLSPYSFSLLRTY